MPVFLDTRSQPTLGIGVCARCNKKMPLAELRSDPNAPGLMVCVRDIDDFDPYRLPARQADHIVLQYARPDQSLEIPGGAAPVTGE